MSEQLRIAMISPYSLGVPGGVQEQARGLAVELARRGHRLTLVSPGGQRAGEMTDHGVAELHVGQVHAVAANGSEAALTFSLRAARATARRIDDQGTDVVHLHEPLAPVLGWPFLRRGGPALVGTFHRSGVDTLYRMAGRLLRHRISRLDAAAAVSAAAAQTAHDVLGMTTEVLFNGIDVSTFAEATPWLTTGPTVLFLGRDEPRKGRDVLLSAVEWLGPEVTVWVTGTPPVDWRSQEGATVEFLGVITEEEKRRRLRAASVLCAPSRGGESFGIILLEAMAAGLPIVCSDIEGYRQAVDGCGVLVPPGNAEALGRALVATVASPSGEAVARGRLRAERWSMTTLADRYEELYARVCAPGRSQRPG